MNATDEDHPPLRPSPRASNISADEAPAGWVRQRGGSDCAIAALATAMSATYEDTAAMLGFSCDPVTRDAIGVDNGMMMLELGAPLLRKGWSGTLLFCDGLHLVGDEARERAAGRVMVKTQELAALIVGRTAVLQVWKEGPLGPNRHFVAYRDGQIIDTDEAGFATYELAKVRVMLAMVLVQSQPASQP
ncbi:MAG: hypothetical protein KDK08_28035 [Rhizobiaceae bacterium]|nr:hypothetical protein [Rhizobiaceae bacterium]